MPTSTPLQPQPPELTEIEPIEELYTRYSPGAYALALKMLGDAGQAEDAVQEAFLKFWRNPGLYNPRQSIFPKWFLMVVRNTCIDVLRKKRHKKVLSIYQKESQDGVLTLIDEATGPEEEVWLKIQRFEIQTALATLPPLQKEVIELAFFKGLTHTQIAETTGRSLGSVKGSIRQGLLKLKVQLDAAKILDEFSDRMMRKRAVELVV